MAGKPLRRVGYGWLAVALIAVILIYWIASNRIASQKALLIQQENTQRVVLSRLETERAALQNEIALSGTDAYIENLARTQYGFLKPGEIRFEITNPESLFSGAEQAVIAVTEGGAGN